MMVSLRPGQEKDRDEVIKKLISIQYTRNDMDFHRGTFRVRGDSLDIFPPYADNPLRVDFWGDEIEEQLTEATTMTSRRESKALVAACRSFSTSSLMEASFSMKVSEEGT